MRRPHIASLDADKFALGFFTVLAGDRRPDDYGDTLEKAIELVSPIFNDGRTKVASFIAWFDALIANLENSELSEFVRMTQEKIRVHPYLLHAASQMALNSNWKFPRKKLEMSARQYLKNYYFDWSWECTQPPAPVMGPSWKTFSCRGL